MDFHEAFSPVRLSSLCLIIAIASKCNLKIHQRDFTTAYLNGKLDEQVVMGIHEYLEETLNRMKQQKSGVKIRLKKEQVKTRVN